MIDWTNCNCCCYQETTQLTAIIISKVELLVV